MGVTNKTDSARPNGKTPVSLMKTRNTKRRKSMGGFDDIFYFEHGPEEEHFSNFTCESPKDFAKIKIDSLGEEESGLRFYISIRQVGNLKVTDPQIRLK